MHRKLLGQVAVVFLTATVIDGVHICGSLLAEEEATDYCIW